MKQRRIGIILSYVNTVLGMVIGLVLSSFLLTKIGNHNYGVYQTISSFANYLVLLEFGVGTVMTRNLAKSRNENDLEKNKQFSSIMCVSILLSIAIFLVAVVFYLNIGNIYKKSLTPADIDYGKKIFVFITIFLIGSFLCETTNGVMQGFENFLYVKGVAVLKLIIRTAAIFIAFVWLPSALMLAVIDAALSLVVLIINVFYIFKKYKLKVKFQYIDKSIIVAIIPYALALLIQSVVNQANNNVDKFLIGIMMRPEDVTIYSIGLFIYSSYATLCTIPISIYLPKIVGDVQKGCSGQELTVNVVEPSRLITLIGGCVFFGFIAMGKKFICLFYGEDYVQAYYVAIIIMSPMFVNMMTGMLINVLDAKGKRMSRSLILLGTTTANIILTIFFIKLWGMIGASIATCITMLIGPIIIMNIYYRKVLNIGIKYLYFKTMKGILPALMIPCIICLLVSLYLPGKVVFLLIEIALFMFLFAVCMFLFGLNDSEKRLFKSAINKMLRR